jgi:hypothetical protein
MTHRTPNSPLLRAYTVFNVDQIDGLAIAQTSDAIEAVSTGIDRADAFIAATGAAITHKGNRACYIPSADRIEMPPYQQFIDAPASTQAEGYYATLLHELVHWTAPKHRCDRDLGKRSVIKLTRVRNSSRRWGQRSSVPSSALRLNHGRIMPPVSLIGSPFSGQTKGRSSPQLLWPKGLSIGLRPRATQTDQMARQKSNISDRT